MLSSTILLRMLSAPWMTIASSGDRMPLSGGAYWGTPCSEETKRDEEDRGGGWEAPAASGRGGKAEEGKSS